MSVRSWPRSFGHRRQCASFPSPSSSPRTQLHGRRYPYSPSTTRSAKKGVESLSCDCHVIQAALFSPFSADLLVPPILPQGISGRRSPSSKPPCGFHIRSRPSLPNNIATDSKSESYNPEEPGLGNATSGVIPTHIAPPPPPLPLRPMFPPPHFAGTCTVYTPSIQHARLL